MNCQHLIYLVGGPQALWNFRTNFSSVIGIIALGTVIVPLAIRSLYLMIENPGAILPFHSNLPRPLMTLIAFLLTPITQILLINSYQSAREKARKAAKANDISQLFKKYREIKGHYVDHIHIERGKNSLKMYF